MDRLTTMVETRMESVHSCFRSIYNFRPVTELSAAVSESANQELGVVGEVGLDTTRRGVMKPIKVVFHRMIVLKNDFSI